MPEITTDLPRVLVAEDDDSLRRLLELRLTADGYAVKLAEDGVTALREVDAWRPDVIVCDVMMPNLSGLSVCRELRSRPAYAKLPIVLLTARVFDEDIQEVMRLGHITYMSKPFDFKALDDTLQLVLEEGILNGDAAPELASKGS